jgi:TonB family protein
VIHQEMPDVSRRARASIRGIIRIVVRVSVDRGGRVVTAALENRASSNYFDRAAVDAAKQWRFSEAADPASRVWRLHFEFARTGTHAHAAAAQ